MSDAHNKARGRNKAGARSGGEGPRASKSGLRVGLREERRQSTAGGGNGEVAEGTEGMETAAPLRGSQETLECMRVVERDVWRRGNAECSERTSSDNVRIDPFSSWQKVTTGEVGNDGVKAGVGTAEPRRGSKGTRKEEKRRAKRLEGSTKMEARENDIRYASRMVVAEKLDSVRKKLK